MVDNHRTRDINHAGVTAVVATVITAIVSTLMPTVITAGLASIIPAMVRAPVLATAPLLSGMAAVMAAAVVVPRLRRGRERDSQRQREGGKSKGPEGLHRVSPAVGSESTIVCHA
ncbi:hypothetical protein GCM10011394_05430 [Luteimonas terricola]|uniref:Efflux RND transporter permease subunit n=1 Tax=Luteimonas terricola TaxID=645597 RepID=A0ABQ2EBW6_9GAMM|nr:hypothetical protein GCM10011394_05430 [Luteimonas terricola]